MSLLTGDPRTATVVAHGDVTVLEIDADAFGTYIKAHPEAVEALAQAAAARRRDLDASRGTTSSAAAIEPMSIARRMRQFFGLE